jgi:micrococcal nuclease
VTGVHLVTALALSGAACSGGGGGSDCGPATATVTRVIDGDTVVLDTGDKVRYLLINAPETTNGHDDCFGQNATQFNSDLVLNKQVDLTYDSQCTDIYGRLLAYVSVDGQEVNALEVQRGYACVLYIPPDGTDRHDEFVQYEDDAKAAGRGMWSACIGMVTCE